MTNQTPPVASRGAKDRCPHCNSPDPARHPAVQFGGEVQICPNSWHYPVAPLLAVEGSGSSSLKGEDAHPATDGAVVAHSAYLSAVAGRMVFRDAYRRCLPVVRAAEALAAKWTRAGQKVDSDDFYATINDVWEAVATRNSDPLAKDDAAYAAPHPDPVPPVVGWQDISTAPRDGTTFDAWLEIPYGCERWEGRQTDVSWDTYGRLEGGPGWGYWHNNTFYWAEIDGGSLTHWQPLPAPPAETVSPGIGLLADEPNPNTTAGDRT